MSSISDKSPALAPTEAGPKDGLPAPVAVRARAPGCTDDAAGELEQLRDRFRKTTNALASAAHDLKTPLAILNGYIEVLQSQKLGPLNERQRDMLNRLGVRDTESSFTDLFERLRAERIVP